MWVFPSEKPAFSDCHLYSSSASSIDSNGKTSDCDERSSQSSSSLNHVQHLTRSESSVNQDLVILEPETIELIDDLIKWSKYLDPCLFSASKYDKVTDLRVLKKFLRKLCKAIFSPQNLTFLTCPNDPTRFYPNPAMELEAFHLDCMKYIGKVIALAMKHQIQIGIAFDQVFLLQLAGENITVEDVKDANPSLYILCKKILAMDDEEFALHKPSSSNLMELCPDRGCQNFDRKDKKTYVSHLVQTHFGNQFAKQASSFAQGFDNVFGKSVLQLLSFSESKLQYLNHVLGGLTNGKRKSMSHNYSESQSTMCRFHKITRRRFDVSNWQKGQLLGTGSFGAVYEVLAGEGLFFAVKQVSLLDDNTMYQIEQEIDVLSQLSHQNIIEFVGTKKDESYLYIFFELVRGGYLERLYQKFHLGDSLVSLYTKQLLEALKYLHDRNIIHGDIKCANILVDEKGCVKVKDFGLSKVIKSTVEVKSCWGTINWMAPEVINRKRGGYGLRADIWGLGCTVLEMLSRKIPYFHLERGAVDYNIGKGNLPRIPDCLSSCSRDFILQCLQINPNDRPTAAQLLNHPFVKGSCS